MFLPFSEHFRVVNARCCRELEKDLHKSNVETGILHQNLLGGNVTHVHTQEFRIKPDHDARRLNLKRYTTPLAAWLVHQTIPEFQAQPLTPNKII